MINTTLIQQHELQSTQRELKFSQAINEAIDLSMANDPAVYVMGLGVPDPKGVFGTTLGLQAKYGANRVMDMPTSENGMTGVAIGSALVGMKPIMVHQRLDFALLAIEQIVNQAANWHYMYGGQSNIPLVIRLIVGRGWGQGPQHSQCLHSWFAHIPGLKVVMPTTAYDAKGLLISSIEDNNPVIFIEHRWLHNTIGHVPEETYRVPLGEAKIVRSGKDLTIVSLSFMTLEAIQAAQTLANCGIDTEIIDVRSLKPFDDKTILESVCKTKRLIVADTGWGMAGFSAEVIARVFESGVTSLLAPPKRLVLPDAPSPCSPGLSKFYYPRATHIVDAARSMFGLTPSTVPAQESVTAFFDIPDPSFTGTFLIEHKEMTKVVVIGSNSFSGADFIDLLLKDDKYNVIGISRSPEKPDLFLPYKKRNSSHFEFHQLDLNKDNEKILELLDSTKPDYIVNFAAQSEVAPSWDYPEHWFETNVVALSKLVNALRKRDYFKRYVHISSPEVYGTCEGTIYESAPLNPTTPYAASKAAADLMLFTLVKNFQFPLTMIRSTNVYGAHQQLWKIIPRSVINVKSNKKIQLHGGGKAIKSYIHIRDISHGELDAMLKGTPGSIYHLSPDSGVSVRSVVQMICEKLGSNFKECTVDVEERLGQDAAYVIDSTKARKELGWTPKINIEQGVTDVIKWVEQGWDKIQEESLVYVHQP